MLANGIDCRRILKSYEKRCSSYDITTVVPHSEVTVEGSEMFKPAMSLSLFTSTMFFCSPLYSKSEDEIGPNDSK